MAVNSIGHAWAILGERITGSRDEAQEYLKGLSADERTIRNRHESRTKVKLRKRRRALGRRS